VNKKNNWNEIARVFIQVKVSLKRSQGQSEGGMTGRGRGRLQEQVVECNDPKRRPVIRKGCWEEKAPCRSEEEEPWDGSGLTVVFQEAVSLFKHVHTRFPRFA